MLLKNLLRNEKWDFVLIEDTLEDSGRAVLKALINDLLSNSWHFHIFCYDNPTEDYKVIFENFSSQIHYYDAYTDPMGWNDCKKNNLIQYKSDVIDYLQTKPDSNSNHVIVFDSLTTLLLHQPYHIVYKMLHNLMRNQGTVRINRNCVSLLHMRVSFNGSYKLMCLLHQDCHDETVINSIELSSSTVIQMLSNKNYNESKSVCSIIHKKPSGKILKEINTFKITDEFSLTDIEKFSSVPQKAKPPIQSDPTAGLTFKLSLEDNEQQARSKLILPYTKVKEQGQGQILYQPDENDDFDEEDPDDDLNI